MIEWGTGNHLSVLSDDFSSADSSIDSFSVDPPVGAVDLSDDCASFRQALAVDSFFVDPPTSRHALCCA